MKTILVVDDNESFSDAISRVLKEYDVLKASRLEDAYNIFLDRNCDIVLMDILLGQQSGIDVARGLLKMRPVPIVAMSGYVSENVLELVPDVFTGYLQKPFTANELREVLGKIT